MRAREEHGGEEGIGVSDKRDGEMVGIEVEWETANRAGCEGESFTAGSRKGRS